MEQLEARIAALEQRTITHDNRIVQQDTRINIIERAVDVSNTANESHWQQYREEHVRLETKVDLYDSRLRVTETNLAVLKNTVMLYAASGGVVGSILASIAIDLITRGLPH